MNIHGLSSQQAQEKLKKFGLNKINLTIGKSLFKIFILQFNNSLTYLLLLASLIIYLLGYHQDAFIISGVLIFNAIIGSVQEKRSFYLQEQLQDYVEPMATVIRDNQRIAIKSKYLVPDDIIILQSGDKIPADCQIIELEKLSVDESILTGESKAVFKKINDKIFYSTYVLDGFCKAIVVKTGFNTEFGKIRKSIDTEYKKTPLVKSLEDLTEKIVFFIVGICAIFLLIGLFTGKNFSQLMVVLTSLFICVVPECLPVIFTLILVSGAARLAKKNVLVRNLSAIEGLGRAKLIVLDKTGTITLNQLMVIKGYYDDEIFEVTGSGYENSGQILTKNNVFNNFWQIVKFVLNIHNKSSLVFDEEKQKIYLKGEATEAALGIFANKISETEYFSKLSIIDFHDFDYVKKMAEYTIFDGLKTFNVKIGSPESVIAENNDLKTQEILNIFLNEGNKVLVISVNNKYALIVIQDNIKNDSADAIKRIKNAGLKIVMATGDHEVTANLVAQKVAIEEVNFRVSPFDKIKIVENAQNSGLIVAMVGDGVNDAAAISKADIGISIGRNSTELAQYASDMILLSDSLVPILDAIKEGRHIFYTIQRVVTYFFATNLGEIFVIGFGLILDLPMPILAPQILWLNLVTDGFLDMALAAEPKEENIISKIWLDKLLKFKFLDNIALIKIIYMGLIMAIGSFLLFVLEYKTNLGKARTLCLISMGFFQLCNAWNCRSEKKSIFALGWFSNKWLIAVTLLVFILQAIVVYVPFFNYTFKTVPLEFVDWIKCFLVGISIIFIEELRKKL